MSVRQVVGRSRGRHAALRQHLVAHDVAHARRPAHRRQFLQHLRVARLVVRVNQVMCRVPTVRCLAHPDALVVIQVAGSQRPVLPHPIQLVRHVVGVLAIVKERYENA